MIVVSHDVEFVQALRPTGCCSCPTARSTTSSDEMLDLVDMA